IYNALRPKALMLASHSAAKARKALSVDADPIPRRIGCRRSWLRRMAKNGTDNARVLSKLPMVGSNMSWASANSRFEVKITQPANGIWFAWPPTYDGCGHWWP